MQTRKLGPFDVTAMGFGCMNLSHAYGPPQPRDVAEKVLRMALEIGMTHFDTAALYGFGANEKLVGEVLKSRPSNVVIVSKCGLFGRDGKRVIDGRPEAIREICEQSLKNLQTDCIDLYYLHRWDQRVPIEESVGALAELKRAGKIRAIGLSEARCRVSRARTSRPTRASWRPWMPSRQRRDVPGRSLRSPGCSPGRPTSWSFRAPRGPSTWSKTVVRMRFVFPPQRSRNWPPSCHRGRSQGNGIHLRRRSKMTPKIMCLSA